VKVMILLKHYGKIFGGVERYSHELINAFKRCPLDKYNIQLAVYSMLMADDVKRKHRTMRVIFRGIKYNLIRKEIEEGNYDVIHIPDLAGGEAPPISFKKVIKKKKRLVITLHGVAPLIFPSNYLYLNDVGMMLYTKYNLMKWRLLFLKDIVKKSSIIKIITVSNASKKEIAYTLKIPKEKINVIYSGVNKKLFRPLPNKEQLLRLLSKKYNINEQYIFCSNSYQPVKNIERLIFAYYVFKRKYGLSLNLVLGGYQPPHIRKMINRLGIQKNVILTGFLEKDDLVKLYNGALAFITTSIHEAFSLVPLEAISCGIPVIASKIPALMEELGNAALYFNPFDIHDIAKKIYMIFIDEYLRKKLINNGKKILEKYTWENCANEYITLYRSVIG